MQLLQKERVQCPMWEPVGGQRIPPLFLPILCYTSLTPAGCSACSLFQAHTWSTIVSADCGHYRAYLVLAEPPENSGKFSQCTSQNSCSWALYSFHGVPEYRDCNPLAWPISGCGQLQKGSSCPMWGYVGDPVLLLWFKWYSIIYSFLLISIIWWIHKPK